MIDSTDEHRHDHLRVVATRDHELIRRWAQRRRAGPATGEATPSGPRKVEVHDDGTGIRFNFPGVQRFRPIEWDEWFENFDRYALVFVYERDSPGATPSARFRITSAERLEKVAHLRG